MTMLSGKSGLKGPSSTPKSRARSNKRMAALKSLFPTQDCREMIRQTLSEESAELTAEDPVLIPEFGEQDLAKVQTDLDNPDIPDEAKKEMQTLLSLAGKRMSELSQLTPEQEAEYLEDQVLTASDIIVTGWLNALYEARLESKDKPVRLDGSLLPPPELTMLEGVNWDEELLNSPLALTLEQIRELMALYAVKLILVFNLMIANNPKGFKIHEDVFICMDTDGFYLPPKAKE